MKNKLHALITQIYKDKFLEKEFIPGETSVPESGKVFDEN